MKKLFLIAAAAFLAVPAFCTTGESAAFTFRSVTEAAKTPELQPADPVYYSSDLAEGTPVSVTITVQDVNEPSRQATLFSDTTGSAVKGNYYWDYTQSPYSSWPSSHTYQLTETVVSSSETKSFYHNVTIAPEPIGFLLLGIAGFLIFRKRAKSLAAVVIALATLTVVSAKADCTVTVSARQFYPLSRMVIIDYTLGSQAANDFTVDFACSSDDWETSYKLSDYGTLSGEGADGSVSCTGSHTAYWTPGSTFDTLNTDNMKIRVTAEEVPPAYMVVDLNNNCAISYLDDVPSGGWTDEYKTTKMVLRYVPAGTFYMGTSSDAVDPHRENTDLTKHEVTLTKAMYVGVFEVTQKQYYLITSADPSQNKGDNRPLENLNFNGVTASGGFFDILNERTSLTFGLPTEAQWEYACRAGTNTDLNDGEDLITNGGVEDAKMSEVGRYSNNTNDTKGGYLYNQHTVVGLYRPNALGLYDMHGNVQEYCRDFISPYDGTEATTDEVGQTDNAYVTVRGGGYINAAKKCRSASRSFRTKSITSGNYVYGFRVFLILE